MFTANVFTSLLNKRIKKLCLYYGYKSEMENILKPIGMLCYALFSTDPNIQYNI